MLGMRPPPLTKVAQETCKIAASSWSVRPEVNDATVAQVSAPRTGIAVSSGFRLRKTPLTSSFFFFALASCQLQKSRPGTVPRKSNAGTPLILLLHCERHYHGWPKTSPASIQQFPLALCLENALIPCVLDLKDATWIPAPDIGSPRNKLEMPRRSSFLISRP